MSPAVISTIVLIIACIISLLYCFRGYKSLKVFMVIYGLYAGYILVMRYFASMAGEWAWIAGLGVGVLFALLAFFFLRFAIFLAGGLLGLVIFYAVESVSPLMFASLSPLMHFLIGAAFFVGVGCLTVAVKRTLIIIGTSFFGAYSFISALGILLGVLMAPSAVPPGITFTNVLDALSGISVYNAMSALVPWVATILLAILGMVRQFRGKGRRKRR